MDVILLGCGCDAAGRDKVTDEETRSLSSPQGYSTVTSMALSKDFSSKTGLLKENYLSGLYSMESMASGRRSGSVTLIKSIS